MTEDVGWHLAVNYGVVIAVAVIAGWLVARDASTAEQRRQEAQDRRSSRDAVKVAQRRANAAEKTAAYVVAREVERADRVRRARRRYALAGHDPSDLLTNRDVS